MTKQFITNYIKKKLDENENYIKYSFFELKVENNLSEKEIDEFLRENKNYFENKNYNVYFTGARFVYNNIHRIVESNELMIAIKEE